MLKRFGAIWLANADSCMSLCNSWFTVNGNNFLGCGKGVDHNKKLEIEFNC
jgi:hypothetical protein